MSWAPTCLSTIGVWNRPLCGELWSDWEACLLRITDDL